MKSFEEVIDVWGHQPRQAGTRHTPPGGRAAPWPPTLLITR
jgi:hypothetical protein